MRKSSSNAENVMVALRCIRFGAKFEKQNCGAYDGIFRAYDGKMNDNGLLREQAVSVD